MDRADARTSQDRVGRLDNHWEIDGDPVAFLDALLFQHIGELAHLSMQLFVSDLPVVLRVVALPNDRGDQTAIIWEGDNPKDDRKITYKQLHAEVSKFANVLKKQGVKKGDRVTIYLPMIVEAAYAILACARIGAIHSVIFGGFSPESIAGRVDDCKSGLVITADEGVRGGKRVPLKANIDNALERTPMKPKVLVLRHTGGDVKMMPGRDV